MKNKILGKIVNKKHIPATLDSGFLATGISGIFVHQVQPTCQTISTHITIIHTICINKIKFIVYTTVK